MPQKAAKSTNCDLNGVYFRFVYIFCKCVRYRYLICLLDIHIKVDIDIFAFYIQELFNILSYT